MPMKQLLTTKEVADLLAVSEVTIRRLTRRGALASYKIGSIRRYHPDDIDEFIASHTG